VNNSKILTPQELTQRAIRFFDRYGKDLEQIKDLLEIRLKQLDVTATYRLMRKRD